VGDRRHTHRRHSVRLRHNHLDLYRQTIEQNLVAAGNLGVVLGEQTERYVQLVDRTLEDVQSRIAELGITSPDELAPALRTAAMGNFLREQLANLPPRQRLYPAQGRWPCADQHAGATGYGLVGPRLLPPLRYA
jgi:hypothetical protein